MSPFARHLFDAIQPLPPAEVQRLLTCPDEEFERMMQERGERAVVLPFPDVRQIEREVRQISL